MVPSGCRSGWTGGAGFTAAPDASDCAVRGRRRAHIDDPRQSLVLGSEGVSTVTTQGTATVRFEDCEAMLCWEDGRRILVGSDAIRVIVEPVLFGLDAGAIAAITESVPAECRVPMPSRTPPGGRVPRQGRRSVIGAIRRVLRR
jgi:zinc protease